MRLLLAFVVVALLAGCVGSPRDESSSTLGAEVAPPGNAVEPASVTPSLPPVVVVREIRSLALDGESAVAADHKSGSLRFDASDTIVLRFSRGALWDDAAHSLRFRVVASETLRLEGPAEADLPLPRSLVEWPIKVVPTASGPAWVAFYQAESPGADLVEVGRIAYDVVVS